jgi:uncharacterized peroxidase-related enzyme
MRTGGPMTIIRTVPEDEAEGEVAALYAEERESLGYLPSHSRVMAMNPAANRAFAALTGSVATPMGLRRYELVTLAAARGTGSWHCRLAHGVKALGAFDEEQLERIARDYADAGLSDAEVAMMRFAERVARDASSMTEADSLALREAGFSDPEIVDIAIAAAARVYLGRMLQALAVEVDVPERLSEPLRAALVDGL